MVSKLTILKRQITRIRNNYLKPAYIPVTINGYIDMENYTNEERESILFYINNNLNIVKNYNYYLDTNENKNLLRQYGNKKHLLIFNIFDPRN